MNRKFVLCTLSLGLVGLLVSVQNGCSGVIGKQNSTSSKSESISGGPLQNSGGQTYDGKIFEILVISGPLCADGSKVISRIVATSPQEFILERDQCVTLPKPQLLDPALVLADYTNGLLIYNNELYVENVINSSPGTPLPTAATLPPPAGTYYSYICQNSKLIFSMMSADKFSGFLIMKNGSGVFIFSGQVSGAYSDNQPPSLYIADSSASITSLQISATSPTTSVLNFTGLNKGNTVQLTNEMLQCTWTRVN